MIWNLPRNFEERSKKNFNDRICRLLRDACKGDTLYATVLAWPGKELTIMSLSPNLRLFPDKISSVELLGSKEMLPGTQDENSLKVKMPDQKLCDYAFVLKIIKKEPSEKDSSWLL